MRKIFFVILMIIVILLTSCSGEEVTPAETEVSAYPYPATNEELSVSTDNLEPYPIPTEVNINSTPTPYPSPNIEQNYTSTAEDFTINTPTPYTVPEAGKDTGVVTGQLIDIETNLPLAKATVYLGTFLKLYPDSYSYTIQERSSPHTYADIEGKFAIGDVPPGEYVLLVWTPFSASVVIDPLTEVELKILVEAGQTVDLGKLLAENPSIQP